MYGFTNPFPMKYGAEKASTLEAILETLLQGQGTALSKERDEFQWVTLHAAARILDELFKANNILANIWNPDKMPSNFIPRFEAIFGLIPNPEDSEKLRRARIATHLFFFRKTPNFSTINDFLARTLGEIYVGINNTTALDANLFVPGGGSVPGGPTFIDGNWSGSICYIAIKIQKPQGMQDSEFYELAGQVQLLDPILPIWVTFDWFNPGPNGDGFYLDSPSNLDNQAFD